jgi:hypothetical protein
MPEPLEPYFRDRRIGYELLRGALDHRAVLGDRLLEEIDRGSRVCRPIDDLQLDGVELGTWRDAGENPLTEPVAGCLLSGHQLPPPP